MDSSRSENAATAMTLTSRGVAREVPWFDHAEFLKVADPVVECSSSSSSSSEGQQLCSALIAQAGTKWTMSERDQVGWRKWRWMMTIVYYDNNDRATDRARMSLNSLRALARANRRLSTWLRRCRHCHYRP